MPWHSVFQSLTLLLKCDLLFTIPVFCQIQMFTRDHPWICLYCPFFILFSITQHFNFIGILFWYYFSIIECFNILKVVRGQGWHQLFPEIYTCSSASPLGREFSLLPFGNLFSVLGSIHHLSIYSYSWISWISGWNFKVLNLYFTPTIRLKEVLSGSSNPQLMVFLWLHPPYWAS